MTWQLFCEINRSLFPWPEKPWRITFWKAAAWLVATCGLVGAYYHAPDAAVHRLITALVNFPALKSEDAILSWDHGNHTLLRAGTALLLFGLVYAGAFSIAAQEHLDYREKLARKLGLKFLSVRRDHEILNLAGDCRTASTEDFAVGGLHLSHVDRHLQLTTKTVWVRRPGVFVEGLSETTWILDVEDDGPRRAYILNFIPPLHDTKQTVRLRITDDIPRLFFMFEEDTPQHDIFESRVETISWLVIEPIDCLELSVTFPHDYQVGGQSQFSVRYRTSRTIHEDEESRLRNSASLTSQVFNGRQTLKLRVGQPVIGLQYYLYWETPKRPTEQKA